jgi:alginate O-acetyltransferase complex protein AlgF
MTATAQDVSAAWGFAALFSTVFGSGLALAADDLYAPAPPAGSAFVRVVNAQPGSAALAATVGGKSAGNVAFGQASAYVVVPQGEREANFGGQKKQGFAVAAGGFYTVALTPTGVVVVNDGTNTNLAKALVSLYNFSGKPSLDLKTADGATTVVAGVASGAAGSRAVNPLTVGFVAMSGAELLYTQPSVTLDRGSAYSLIVMGPPEKPTGTWVKSATRAN